MKLNLNPALKLDWNSGISSEAEAGVRRQTTYNSFLPQTNLHFSNCTGKKKCFSFCSWNYNLDYLCKFYTEALFQFFSFEMSPLYFMCYLMFTCMILIFMGQYYPYTLQVIRKLFTVLIINFQISNLSRLNLIHIDV